MGTPNQAIRSKIVQGRNPTIYNKTVASKDVEESQTLNNGVKKFMIKCRGNANIKLSYIQNESDTTYITIPKGSVYNEEGLDFSGTIYFQTDLDGQVVEIVEWI